MYVLVNGHTLWRNSLIDGKTRDECTQSSFRFEIIRVWYAVFKKSNGSMGILHYPSRKLSTRKWTVDMILMSPRKGHHNQQIISANDNSSKMSRIKCRICHMKTSFQCQKCSNPGEPLALCSQETQRSCWNRYHIAMELPCSQSGPSQENWQFSRNVRWFWNMHEITDAIHR